MLLSLNHYLIIALPCPASPCPRCILYSSLSTLCCMILFVLNCPRKGSQIYDSLKKFYLHSSTCYKFSKFLTTTFDSSNSRIIKFINLHPLKNSTVKIVLNVLSNEPSDTILNIKFSPLFAAKNRSFLTHNNEYKLNFIASISHIQET